MNVDRLNRPIFVLRGLLICLVTSYGMALYSSWCPAPLSVEAAQYQDLAWLSGSGFSLYHALQKIFWILGNCAGVLGLGLVLFRIQNGLALLILCAPLLVASALFGATPSAYPNVESTASLLLWCATSALWGAVVVFMMLQRHLLFRAFEEGV